MIKTYPFDPAEYLDEDTQTELLEEALGGGDPGEIAYIIGTIARAKHGFLTLERRTGIKRQTLARSFGKSGNPTLETLLPVLRALGLRLRIEPAERELADA